MLSTENYSHQICGLAFQVTCSWPVSRQARRGESPGASGWEFGTFPWGWVVSNPWRQAAVQKDWDGRSMKGMASRAEICFLQTCSDLVPSGGCNRQTHCNHLTRTRGV